MDFIKNIKGDFILSQDYNLLKSVYALKTKIIQPELRVKIKDINLDNITFELSDPTSLSSIVDDVIDDLISQVEKNTKKTKKIANKVIKCWNEYPENFKLVERASKLVYENPNLLTDNEYHNFSWVSFDKISIGYGLDFTTGWGGGTYYPKEYFVEHMSKIDKWLENEIEKIKSKKFKKRISIYAGKTIFSLSYSDVLKYITIPQTQKDTKQTKKPKFPINITGEQMNNLLDEFDDHVVIDKDFISKINELDICDLSLLEDWEIIEGTKEYHSHDGDTCNYIVIFTSPEGHEYNFYDNHCLIVGYNFTCNENLEPN